MAMTEIDLSDNAWHEIDDLDDPSTAFLQITGTNAANVIASLSVASPALSTPAFTLDEGFFSFPIPGDKTLWVKCTSGSAEATYSAEEEGGFSVWQWDGAAWDLIIDGAAATYDAVEPATSGDFTGETRYGSVVLASILLDDSKCAFARADFVAVDELFTNVNPRAGFNDNGVADPVTYLGYLHTTAANLTTVTSAILNVDYGTNTPGRTMRIYGVAEVTSQFGTLTDYASLAGLSLTTAFEDLTVDDATIDITSIIAELVGLGGWDASSPIQLWIADPNSVSAGNDVTCIFDRAATTLSVVP